MANPPSPTLVLAAYGADFFSGRRVVVFGNALAGLADALVERGARLVHVYDEQPTRVAEANARATTPAVSYAPFGPGGIAARDGAFDVGIVENLHAATDPTSVVQCLRRALSARGVGFVCASNPDRPAPRFAAETLLPSSAMQQDGQRSLGYYDLYDLVSAEFDEIRMVGQTPFVGYALADFSPDADSEFSIDTEFVPGGAEEAERFVAVCSHFPVVIDPFCVVQLPADQLLIRAKDSQPEPSSSLVERQEVQATRHDDPGNVDAQSASADIVAGLQQDLKQALALATSEREQRLKHESLLQQAHQELQRRDEWVAELEGRATTADERADEAQAQSEHALLQITKAQRDLATLKQELKEARAALEVSDAHRDNKLSAHEAALAELQATNDKLTEREKELAVLREELKVLSGELSQCETLLSQQGRTLLELQAALRDTEVFASTLLMRLSPSPEVEIPEDAEHESEQHAAEVQPDWDSVTTDEPDAAPEASGEDETELRAALQREATHLAALEAARWTVEELENRLRSQSDDDVQELLHQLHVARQQLQRQAALIEQYKAAHADTM